MRKLKAPVALFLAVIMLVAMIVPTSAAASETVLSSDNFEQFATKNAGTTLTKDDGFGLAVPSTTKVAKDDGNTYITVDFKAAGDPNKTVYYLSSGTKTDASDPEATKTDEASYGLIWGDANIDKNLVMLNDAVSYTTTPTVILETQYYISEKADGTILSQIYKYTTDGTSKSYLHLFTIDSETGYLAVSGTRTENKSLNIGAWNTVSLVFDLATGKFDLYINYSLSAENADTGATKLAFNANSYIYAKIQRTRNASSNAANDLSGYFGIDNVRIYTPGDNTITEITSINDKGENLMVANLVQNGKTIASATPGKVLCTNGVTVEATYFAASTYDGVISSAGGASFRFDPTGGIRFVSKLDPTKYNALKKLLEDGTIADLRIGTIIAPYDYVKEAGAFTTEALSKLGYGITYVDVEATDGAWYGTDENGNPLIAGSLASIQPYHYDVKFAGIGYVEITHVSGEITTYYSTYDNSIFVSIATLSQSALQAGDALEPLQISLLNQFEVTTIFEDGEQVSDMYYSNNAFFFTLNKGNQDVYCSLVYSGNHGWRFMAQSVGDMGFQGMGASQALAVYLDEEPMLDAKAIKVTQTANYVRLSCADGSNVNIYLDDFMMMFLTPKNNAAVTVTDVSTTAKTVTMKGSLDFSEGIYGGGERFDTVNKRGTSFELYTADGWNNSSTTYMAIPVFSTTAGGGMFINRYESMTTDWGKKESDEWSITLQNPLMDCYFYASGEMEDVLTGYTKLSGSPDLPEEWMQGVIICRYSSDLKSFDVDTDTTNKDGAPSGRSVKTIVNSLIAAGMKPSAVLMEPYGWTNLSKDTDVAKANAATMKEMIKWLHDQDIKAMFYMGVASLNSNMAGYKEEYQVRAYVDGVLTHKIPKTSGTGTNPDVSTSGTQQYLDITNPEAVDWYMNTIWGQMIELGADGIKIDFCECMPEEGSFGNGTIDYVWYDETVFEQGTIHHAYPTYFISLFYREMNRLQEEKQIGEGFMVLSRGGGIGSQRNPYLWAGDQARNFDKLDDQLMAVINSGMSGVPFMTYDMAGYRYNGGGVAYTDPNSLEYESGVMARGVEFSAFMPNIQSHGTVRNAYELNADAQEIYINFTTLHSELADYITKYSQIACESGVPVARHPVLKYQDDENVYSLNDVFMLGDGLYIAPIYYADQTSREVYLPEGSWTNLLTGKVIEGGQTITVEANLGQIPVFLNNDSADADELREIFEGDTWTAIKNWTPNAN